MAQAAEQQTAPIPRHASLYFPDGTLTLKVDKNRDIVGLQANSFFFFRSTYDGSAYYNVYRQPLILKSDFFSGMLTLPISGAAGLSLSQSSKDLIEAARKAGHDGSSDATAVAFPKIFTGADCEVFLEFIFNVLPWTKDTPALKRLCAVLKTCDFFGAESGTQYAIHHLEDHPDLGPALRYRLASDYSIERWAKRAFYELMSGSMLEISEADDVLLGWDAYRALTHSLRDSEIVHQPRHGIPLELCRPSKTICRLLLRRNGGRLTATTTGMLRHDGHLLPLRTNKLCVPCPVAVVGLRKLAMSYLWSGTASTMIQYPVTTLDI
ncbi:hypothetical protein B0H17DRAFT_1211601 [Mycena rosella]|uniref:BTB domain-containing protein n=1 Tax=Mycena rosella TaxID=1033263 RepID=A0AAD7CU17_MYCRO|nr:hypothetical protein B0H17DRAFT_1211601 [Mycena rosella]